MRAGSKGGSQCNGIPNSYLPATLVKRKSSSGHKPFPVHEFAACSRPETRLPVTPFFWSKSEEIFVACRILSSRKFWKQVFTSVTG
ncbi:hypothetical protein Mal52_62160 [Symmachiella dynata]|uniref:Uncharacterized protein n=1 Tax=Symmachiella dynata TaxID=2527995 RepID=A0A517ZZ11_9PLAN|nr:hypothetical protein Mal52_62160 [Symmachiella dynata]